MAGIIFSKGSGLNDSIYGKSQEPIRAVMLPRSTLMSSLVNNLSE